MNSAQIEQTPLEFISARQKSVMEAPNVAASMAALPQIFDRDLKIFLNGQELGWAWLEQHMRELHARLKNIRVHVTHAAREGNVLLERHTVSATALQGGDSWQAEIMAVYELTDDQKIKTWRELAKVPGEYTGW
jgi:limonene-1,2-epoxide hydrolase